MYTFECRNEIKNLKIITDSMHNILDTIQGEKINFNGKNYRKLFLSIYAIPIG